MKILIKYEDFPNFSNVCYSSPLSLDVKTKPQYESQELRVEFDEEPLEVDPNDLNIRDAAQSVSDSGEESTSFHTDDKNPPSPDSDKGNNENPQILFVESDHIFINGNGPIMASSPRPNRDTRQVGNDPTSDLPGNICQNHDINEGEESTKIRSGSVLLLDSTLEEETDDIVTDGDANDPKGSRDTIANYRSLSEGKTVKFEKESEHMNETSADEAEMLGNTSTGEGEIGVKEEKCNDVESVKDETDSFIESTSF